jgi:hypothetical protein
MRTNFWMGFAQVVLIIFAAAMALIAVQKMNTAANYYRIAALATVATASGTLILDPTPTLTTEVAAQPALVSRSAKPGGNVTYSLVVSNNRASTKYYHLSARSSAGWANLSGLPASFSLAGGGSVQFSINVQVPLGISGQRDDTSIVISSGEGEQESALLTTSACQECSR